MSSVASTGATQRRSSVAKRSDQRVSCHGSGIGPCVTGGRVSDQMNAPRRTTNSVAPKILMMVPGVLVML